ncbi:hypothetical protein RQP46_005136 [Phenoliferia psychrophenolica]
MHLPILLTALAFSLASAIPSPPSQLPFSLPPPSSSLPSLSSLNLSPSHLSSLQSHIASLPERRLVQLSEGGAPISIAEGEKALLVFQGTRFIDVTDEVVFPAVLEKEEYGEKLAYSKKALQPLMDHIDLEYMETFLSKFSGFRTRYFRSETGKQSQKFLLAELQSIAATSTTSNITFREFQHPWGQHSIIARFEPSSPSSPSLSSSKVVILSAHQDSINQLVFLPAPGADDDGSGTTSNLMAFKALVKEGFVPSTNAVEVHFYSAEEGGMLGSQAVAQGYRTEGKAVRAMLHLDQTAWVKKGSKPVIALINDNVDAGLTAFIRKLVVEYSDVGYVDTQCGYACSDHASWTKIGAPSACASESDFPSGTPNAHGVNDSIDYSPEFSFEHMAQYFCLDLPRLSTTAFMSATTQSEESIRVDNGNLHKGYDVGGAPLRSNVTPGGHPVDNSQPAFPVYHRKFANPGGAAGVHTPHVVLGMALFYGGFIQLLAGMWEMASGNTFAATAFSSYGGFWLSYAMLIAPWSGVAAAYTDPAEMRHAIGFFLIGWLIFSFIMLVASLRSSVALSSIFFWLVITLALLAAAEFVPSMPAIHTAGGVFGLITTFNAWYVAAAGLLTPETSYFTLPVGDLARRD